MSERSLARRIGLGTPSRQRRCLGEMVERIEDAARRELDLAEAELAVLKQELILQHLVDIGEPTEEARTALARLRHVAAQLSASGREADAEAAGEAA